MMKKYNIVLFSFFLFVLSSCGDNFLDIYPTGMDSVDEYYRTEEEIFKALVGAYDPLTWTDYYSGGYNQIQFISDVRSDDIFVGGDFGSRSFHHEMAEFDMDPLKAPTSLWETFYTGISRANTVIEKMDQVEEIDEEVKNRYLAEAVYLRAYYYHWLWKFWGNIPYYENILEPPYFVKQLPADEVYEKIVHDLDRIIEEKHLPLTVSNNELGRVTLYAAMMLRARVVMYQNDESRYEAVYNDMVTIGNSNFILTRNFADIWKNEYEFITEPSLSRTESIWEINHREEGGSWDWPQGGQGTVYPKWLGIPSLSENDPEFQDGWGFGPVRKEIYDLYPDADQRKDAGIIYFEKRKQLLQDSLGITISYSPRYEDTGYFNAKYTARKGYNNAAYDVELNFNNNVRIFRYSEALLNAAELAIKLGKGQNVAQNYLNLVRARALYISRDDYRPTHPHYVVATEESILQERRLEFVGEGMRFWDLVRTGNTHLLTESNEYWSRTWSDNYKYLPIPSTEIDRTEGEYKLVQNPGYR
ncbi:MAG: RagB/SusD family nutrient uptake outer membrane protein [Candidatus Azobacteroides sp.]|nr:RagB/SusD family nutrient uptake outer membrane protein [Candidatus Azobacteroides sp.]